MTATALHADELTVIDLDDTKHKYEDVHYTPRHSGNVAACTVYDNDGHIIAEHADVLMTQARKDRKDRR